MLPGRKSSGPLSLLELPVILTADSAAVASADDCNARLVNTVLLRTHLLLWVLLIKVLLLLLWLLLDFVYENVATVSGDYC